MEQMVYILKDSDSEILINAVKTAYQGGILLNPEVSKNIIDTLNNNNLNQDAQKLTELKKMTDRELDVAKLISNGQSNKNISEELFLTEGTVKNYVTMILEKLNLNNRTELAIYVNKANLK